MSKEEVRKQWEKRVEEYKASNMSASAWCRANNINPSTFWYWLNRDKTKVNTSVKLKKESEQLEWLPIEIKDDKKTEINEDTFVVKIGSAIIEVKEGFNRNLFKDIIDVLVSSC